MSYCVRKMRNGTFEVMELETEMPKCAQDELWVIHTVNPDNTNDPRFLNSNFFCDDGNFRMYWHVGRVEHGKYVFFGAYDSEETIKAPRRCVGKLQVFLQRLLLGSSAEIPEESFPYSKFSYMSKHVVYRQYPLPPNMQK